MATAPLQRPVSPTDAARAAFDHTRRQLFPIRLEKWILLGLLAFLDQCGRSWNGGGGAPGGEVHAPPPPEDWTAGVEQFREALQRAAEWLSAHAAMIALATIAGIVAFGLLAAAVLWLNARGVMMYADAVATGRAELGRPWREHATAAASYFRWSLGITLAGVFTVLFAVLVVGATLLAFAEGRLQGGGSLMLVAIVPVLLLLALALPILALAALSLRDFVAPLQLATGLPCGEAARLFEALVVAQPGVFVLYLLLRLLIAIASGLVIAIGGCLTCCIGFLPLVMQTVFQPLFHIRARNGADAAAADGLRRRRAPLPLRGAQLLAQRPAGGAEAAFSSRSSRAFHGSGLATGPSTVKSRISSAFAV